MPGLADMQPTSSTEDTLALDSETISAYLQQVNGWQYDEAVPCIFREFRFKNYYHTMAFVNAVAWIAHQTDHHPDMEVGYNRCRVSFTTHSLGAISLNDFICSARIEAIGLI